MQRITYLKRPTVPTFTDIVRPFSPYAGRYGQGRFGKARYGGAGAVPIARPNTVYTKLVNPNDLPAPYADIGGADVIILNQ